MTISDVCHTVQACSRFYKYLHVMTN